MPYMSSFSVRNQRVSHHQPSPARQPDSLFAALHPPNHPTRAPARKLARTPARPVARLHRFARPPARSSARRPAPLAPRSPDRTPTSLPARMLDRSAFPRRAREGCEAAAIATSLMFPFGEGLPTQGRLEGRRPPLAGPTQRLSCACVCPPPVRCAAESKSHGRTSIWKSEYTYIDCHMFLL